MRTLLYLVIIAVITYAPPVSANNNGPPVKKSRSGICHAAGSTYYDRTQNYTPYKSMEACLKSGGRRPMR